MRKVPYKDQQFSKGVRSRNSLKQNCTEMLFNQRQQIVLKYPGKSMSSSHCLEVILQVEDYRLLQQQVCVWSVLSDISPEGKVRLDEVAKNLQNNKESFNKTVKFSWKITWHSPGFSWFEDYHSGKGNISPGRFYHPFYDLKHSFVHDLNWLSQLLWDKTETKKVSNSLNNRAAWRRNQDPSAGPTSPS